MLRLALRVWEAVQAGHELILMCENDLGCQQVRCITPPGFIAHVRYPVWEFISVPSNKRPQAKFAPQRNVWTCLRFCPRTPMQLSEGTKSPSRSTVLFSIHLESSSFTPGCPCCRVRLERQPPLQETSNSLSFSSTDSTSQKPFKQLQILAELLLWQSQLKSELSPDAWFPADPFVLQFQQHRRVLLQGL